MRRDRGLRVLFVAFAVLALAGCGSNGQNTMAPASPQEHRISILFWIMLAGTTIAFAILLTFLILGYFHRQRRGLPFGASDKVGTGVVIGLGVATPIVLLIALFIYSDVFVNKTTSAPAPASTSRTVAIRGYQWFWQATYEGTDARVPDDIHIPTRTRVDVPVSTADVIHSLWVPELNRKIDTIPGTNNSIVIQANRPGAYRGQCAEFCGLQHAHMALMIYADPPAKFRKWLANQAAPARTPTTAEEKRGRQIFLSQACSGCHTIRGTSAQGRIGPDLTHVASRPDLAGLAFKNTRANLIAWINDPQKVKPGVKMPDLHLSMADIRSVVTYLESLK